MQLSLVYVASDTRTIKRASGDTLSQSSYGQQYVNKNYKPKTKFFLKKYPIKKKKTFYLNLFVA